MILKKKITAAVVLCMFSYQTTAIAQFPLTVPAQQQQPNLISPKTSSTMPNYGKPNAMATDVMTTTISIHVLGEVTNPGSYYLKANDRLLRSIQEAGGLTEKAARTRVELRRNGKTLRTCNLLQLNRDGDLRNSPFLQDNDVVYIPRVDSSVKIQGAVMDPGTYEITDKESISDLIKSAEGFTVGYTKDRPILVIRYDDKSEKTVFELKEAQVASFKLENGDIVHVPHKFTFKNNFDVSTASLPNDNIAFPTYTSSVFILGGIKISGPFPFVPQYRLANYISQSGGLTRLGREDVEIYKSDGRKIKTTINSDVIINPGDSVVVGEDKLGPEFWITLMTTMVSIGLSGYAILKK